MKKELNIVNRRAAYDYEFLESYEAGLVLKGVEVKAIRAGHVTLNDAFCFFQEGQLVTQNLEIQCDGANPHLVLLLHKKELQRLGKSLEKGLSIVVTGLVTRKGRIKVCLALGKGKKSYDKRQSIKERDVARELKQNA